MIMSEIQISVTQEIPILKVVQMSLCSRLLIIPFWYASAAYLVTLFEPWFIFWRDPVEPKINSVPIPKPNKPYSIMPLKHTKEVELVTVFTLPKFDQITDFIS